MPPVFVVRMLEGHLQPLDCNLQIRMLFELLTEDAQSAMGLRNVFGRVRG